MGERCEGGAHREREGEGLGVLVLVRCVPFTGTVHRVGRARHCCLVPNSGVGCAERGAGEKKENETAYAAALSLFSLSTPLPAAPGGYAS